MFIFDKLYFKPKLVRKDKKGHSILIKGTIQQEEKKLLTYMYLMLVFPISLNKHF
jgi:hypothetical protein